MSDTSKTCANCAHWKTADDPDTAVIGDCALRKIPRPEFWQGCASFVARERAAAEQAQTVAMYWGQYISGTKQ